MRLQLHECGDDKELSQPRTPICEYLLGCGKISEEQVSRALRLQSEQSSHEKVGSILIKLGLVSERDVAESLSEQLDMPLVAEKHIPGERVHVSEISENFLRKREAVPIDEDDTSLTLLMADPQDAYTVSALKLCTGKSIVIKVGVPSEIEAALQNMFNNGPTDDTLNGQSTQYLDDVEQLKELAGEAPVIKLVNRIIGIAAESGASDIHIEPFDDQLKVRYRVDGLLRESEAPPLELAAAVISRIKIMANLNIAERRLSQDGRFKYRVRGVDYDFRVSTVPTMHGESVVMRLLQRDQHATDFESLGFSTSQTAAMHEILSMPHGILLVTGPTGSGKSTTLYAALSHLNNPERMIITVEDPVEYNINGINQIQVKPKIDLTFANALRSIVRQDPDVIMIGEMRDNETAQIAVQSALTGHLVLSTLHTNDAPSSIMRLVDMGVPDYLLTSAVKAVQAQRLVRKLCASCREVYQPLDEVIERCGLQSMSQDKDLTLYRATGCELCGHTGFSGRTAIIEILGMSDAIRKLVLGNADANSIRRQAVAEGMLAMHEDGYQKALAGITTIEEVFRVTAGTAE